MDPFQEIMSECSQFAGLRNSEIVYHIELDGKSFSNCKGSNQFVHWGSCAKALAGVVCAVLVDKKQIQFESTLASLNLVAFEKFSRFTVSQLLRHESGLAEDLSEDALKRLGAETSHLSPTDARAMYCECLEKIDLVDGLCYSNAGYTLLAHAIEKYLNRPWELLVLEVTELLGMKSVGFGMPSGMIGHDENDEPVPGFKDSAFHNPPLAVHSNMDDWVKFAGIFSSLLHGDKNAFQACGVSFETASSLIVPNPIDIKRLRGHELPPGYAAGWRTRWNDEEEEENQSRKILWHLGTNFVTQSGIVILSQATPDRRLIVCMGSNSGSMMLRFAFRNAVEKIFEFLK